MRSCRGADKTVWKFAEERIVSRQHSDLLQEARSFESEVKNRDIATKRSKRGFLMIKIIWYTIMHYERKSNMYH
mgnify:CR=1 FL=1